MPVLHIVLDPETTGFDAMRRRGLVGVDPAQAIEAGRLIHLRNEVEVGALAAGMQSGAPSVAFCFELPDERVVLAETSLALFLTAADALRAKYGDPR